MYKDQYRIRQYPMGYFSHVLDIGASSGIFSLFSTVLHPNARVVGIEAHPATCETAKQNLKSFRVEIYNEALGRGGKVGPREWPENWSLLGHSYIEEFAEGSDPEKTIDGFTLSQLGVKHDIDPHRDRVLLKIDCEGNERHILTDKNSRRFLEQCHHVAVEIHFSSANKNSFWSKLGFPTWEEYNNFFRTMNRRFDILYYKSSKWGGVGHMILSIKEYLRTSPKY